jgi:uncharacterized membrane protein (Fun14 family)
MANNKGVFTMPRQASSQGFLENLKDLLNPAKFIQKVQSNKETLFNIAIFGGVGFLAGFLLKKYNRYVAALVFIILALIGLDFMGIISISMQWDRLYDLFGIEPLMPVEGNAITVYTEWLRANFFMSASFIIGFLFGLRIG